LLSPPPWSTFFRPFLSSHTPLLLAFESFLHFPPPSSILRTPPLSPLTIFLSAAQISFFFFSVVPSGSSRSRSCSFSYPSRTPRYFFFNQPFFFFFFQRVLFLPPASPHFFPKHHLRPCFDSLLTTPRITFFWRLPSPQLALSLRTCPSFSSPLSSFFPLGSPFSKNITILFPSLAPHPSPLPCQVPPPTLPRAFLSNPPPPAGVLAVLIF